MNIDHMAVARRIDRAQRYAVGTYERGMNRFRLLPLDQLRGLARVVDQCESGVYFLWNGPELLYIGISTNVSGRVGQHKWAKPHTRATYMHVSWRCMDRYEDKYIWHYGPPLNSRGRKPA